jgi:hypothetical protein
MQFIQKRTYVFIWLIFFMLIFSIQSVSAADVAEMPKTDAAPMSHYVSVTYFHTTARCPTCHKIEELSNDTIRFNFEDELKTGKVVWRVINVDEPENEHYIQDYQLYSKHLIVSEIKDGKEVRWKNLEKIWTLVRDEEKFEEYVKTEINDWLKE